MKKLANEWRRGKTKSSEVKQFSIQIEKIQYWIYPVRVNEFIESTCRLLAWPTYQIYWPFEEDLQKSLNPNFKNMLLYQISKQQFSIWPNSTLKFKSFQEEENQDSYITFEIIQRIKKYFLDQDNFY